MKHNRIWAFLLVLVMLFSLTMTAFASPAPANAPVIDTTKTGSITIYKLDKTRIEIDGKTQILLDNPADGQENSTVYDELINNGETYTIGNGQTSKGYAIKGVVYSYLKVADIVQYSENVSGETKVMVLYEMDDTQDADLLAALGLTNANAYPVQAGNGFTPASGKHYFESSVLTTALQTKLSQNSVALKNALEAYMTAQNAGTFDPTDSEGKTTKDGLPLGLYLVVETSVPEMVTSTTAPFLVSLPMVGNTDPVAPTEKPEYYSTLHLAVADANAGTPGENADVNIDEAVAAIYFDANKLPNVTMLKNTTITEGVTFTRNAVLNLNGHKITANGVDTVVSANNDVRIRIDGRTLGGEIESTGSTAAAPTLIQGGDYLEILSGTYKISAANAVNVDVTNNALIRNAAIVTTGDSNLTSVRMSDAANNLKLDNCEITTQSSGASGTDFGLRVNHANTVAIDDCTINTTNSAAESAAFCTGIRVYNNNADSVVAVRNSTITSSSYSKAVGIGNSTATQLLVENTTVSCDCKYDFPCLPNRFAFGISSSGKTLVRNCDVTAAYYAVGLNGEGDVDGGTYKSLTNTIYLTGGNVTERVRNATISNEWPWTSEYAGNKPADMAGINVGGGGANTHDLTVYVDNCTIHALDRQIYFRDQGEKDNKLYVSNTNIDHLDASSAVVANEEEGWQGSDIQIYNDTCDLYIGNGNNFGVSHVGNHPERAHEAAETYEFTPLSVTGDYNGESIVGNVTAPANTGTEYSDDYWLYDVVLYPKNLTGIPELEKLVRESKTDTGKNNGTNAITDGYAHTATASSGDKIDYLFFSRLPVITSDATGLTTYTFTDTLCKGLEYNGNSAALTMLKGNYNASDVSIKFFEDAACTTEITTWAADSGKFTVTYGTADNDATTMTVAMTAAGLREINTSTAVYDSTNGENRGYGSCYMLVFYSATMNQNADVNCGNEGNDNTVTLTWKRSNQDYYDTLTDDCHVYTYGIDLTKRFDPVPATVDYSQVEFKLYNVTDSYWVTAEKVSDGVYYVKGENKPAGWVEGTATEYSVGSPLVPGADGTLKICGIEDDTYRLTETRTANGYNLLAESIEITITAAEDDTRSCDIYSTDNRGVYQNEFKDAKYSGTNYNQRGLSHYLLSASAAINGETVEMTASGTSEKAFVPLTVINGVGYQMPETGEQGTWIMSIIGIIGMTAAIVFIIFYKKRKEDAEEIE